MPTTMLVKRFILLDDFQTNTYLVWCKQKRFGIVIDPADKAEKLYAEIKRLDLDIKYIINTHGHADHIGANNELKKLTGAKLCIHPLDKEMLIDAQKNFSLFFGFEVTSPEAEIMLQNEGVIKFGDQQLRIIHTPGHSPGSVCLYNENMLFSGDTIFFEGLGRTDLPGGNQADLLHSINEKLFVLPHETKIYPGHGGYTNIKHEKKYNPASLF